MTDTDDLAALRAFALDIMRNWPEGDVCGGDLQAAAIDHGLLAPVEAIEPCGDSCWCEEYYGEFPVTCYRRTPRMTGTEASQ